MQNDKLNPDDAFKTLLIIWFALVMSQVIFVVMVYAVKPELLHFDLTYPILGKTSIVVAALGLVSLTNLAISFAQRKKFLAQSVDQRSVGLVQTAMIIGCALCESVSLLVCFWHLHSATSTFSSSLLWEFWAHFSIFRAERT